VVIRAVLADKQTSAQRSIRLFDGVRFPILNQRVGGAQDCSCGMVDVGRYMLVVGVVCGLVWVVVSEWVMVGVVEGWMTRRG
jgi:hypothetical protein